MKNEPQHPARGGEHCQAATCEASGSDALDLEARWLHLVARIRGGERNAAEDWVSHQWRPVWMLLRRRLGEAATPDLARGALAEALLEVRAGRIERPGQLVSWLQKWALRHPAEDSGSSVTTEPPLPALQVSRLAAAIRESEPRQREALRRYYVEGQTAEQIATDLGLSVEEFFQARVRLRELVTPARKPADKARGWRIRKAASA